MSTELESTGNEFVEAMRQVAASAPAPEPVAQPPVQPPPQQVSTPEPPVQQPVSPEPPQPQTPVPPEPVADRSSKEMLRNAARKMGLDIRDEDEAEEIALVALQNVHAARRAQEYLLQQQLAAQGQPAPETKKPPKDEFDLDAHFEKRWQTSWSAEFDQYIQTGLVVPDPETGAFVAKPGCEVIVAQVLPKINEAHQRNHRQWAEFTKRNPYKEVYKEIEEPIVRRVERLVEERLAQLQYQNQTQDVEQRFVNENASWLYQQDPVTKEVVPTADGSRMFRAYQALIATGETNPANAIKEALELTGLSARIGGQQAAPPQPVQPPAPIVQSPQQSFLERAKQASAYSPSVNGPGTDPGFQVTNEADLDQLFVRSYNSSRSR